MLDVHDRMLLILPLLEVKRREGVKTGDSHFLQCGLFKDTRSKEGWGKLKAARLSLRLLLVSALEQ